MPELVRVKDPVSGHEFTTNTDHATGSDPQLEVIDKPAVDDMGHPLPPLVNVGRAPKKENS